ncbi:T-lymphocyte activation antigen CD86 [Festucalex cinctus]
MASAGIVLWLLTMVCVSGQNVLNPSVKLDCNKESLGQYGQPSVVECMIMTSRVVNDLTVETIVWKKNGSEVLLVHYNIRKSSPGYSFAEPSWNSKSLNVSLLIANTSVTDHGNYSCMVITDSGSYTSSASLRVTAKYNTPSIHTTTANVTPNSKVTLTCRSEGGYPKGRLGWFVGANAQEDASAETVARVLENGLFSLSTELTLSQGWDSSKYTCVVFNVSGGKDDEASLMIPKMTHLAEQGRDPEVKGLDVPTKVVAPVVVIGSLIVGLLLYLTLKRKHCKREQVPRPGTDPEQGCPREHLLVIPECQETKA